MKKYLYISFALAVFFFAATQSSYACSCIASEEPLKKQVQTALKESDAVFVGEVVAVTQTDDKYGYNVRIKIAKKWKGVETEEITIRTAQNSAMCGFYFEIGKSYLVYATKTDGGLITSICTRTAEFKNNEDLKYLKKVKTTKKRN